MNGFRIVVPADNSLNLHFRAKSENPCPGSADSAGIFSTQSCATSLNQGKHNGGPRFQPGRGLAAKLAAILLLAGPLLLSMSGCGKRTPTYSGPPDLVIHMVMKKWAILPDRIQVVQGTKVEIIVSTADVEHGLGVPDLGIREPVQPGKPATVRFLAQTPGVYPMKCSVLCGRGHKRMTGEIIITPAPARPAAQPPAAQPPAVHK